MSFPIKITLNDPPEGYAAEAEIVKVELPSDGDWFLSSTGCAEIARCNFASMHRPILRLTKLEEGPNEIVRFFVPPGAACGGIFGFDDLGGEWICEENCDWVKHQEKEWSIDRHLEMGSTEIFPRVKEPAQPADSPKVVALKKIVTEDPRMPQWIKDRLLAQIDVDRVEYLLTAKVIQDAVDSFCKWRKTKEGIGFWGSVFDAACSETIDYPPNPDEPAQPALPDGWIWADGLAFAPIEWSNYAYMRTTKICHIPCECGRVVGFEGTQFRICGYSDEPNISKICMSPCTHKADRKYAVLKVEDGQC